MAAAHTSFQLRLRRSAALLILGWSFFCWVIGLAGIANGFIGLITGKEQWVQVGTTTMFGLGPVFGVGAICVALGYGLGRAGIILWRNPQESATAMREEGERMALEHLKELQKRRK